MVLHVNFQVLLALLAAVAAQFMPPMQHMPQPQFYYPQPQMPMPNGMPGAMGPGMPPGMPQPMLPHLPHMPGMAMHPSMHMPQMQMPMHGGRLPMVVMPRHTKKNDKKKSKKSKKRNRKRSKMEYSSNSEDSCSSESEYHQFRAKNELKPRKKRREILTPVVSYVTKDGYVVYQKKIKKDKAKDWLEMSKVSSDEFAARDKSHDH